MKYLVLAAGLFLSIQANAQEKTSLETSSQDFNRWTIEAMTGFSDGNYPYGPGFNPGDKKHVLSHFKINNFDLGLRYMFTPKFGLKANLAYGTYTDKGNSSLPYETEHFNFALQGVVNAAKVLDFGSETRIGLLLYGGVHLGSLTSKTDNVYNPTLGMVVPNSNLDNTEYHGGFVAGITPQLRVTQKLALFADVSVYYNYRQHMNWDGSRNTSDLLGKNTNLSVGLSYSLGKDKIHGDWATIANENDLMVEEMQNEMDKIQTMMQDTDRDGVPDYLDAEPNTVGGVAVDTKGRAIDVNKNGIPDELEGRDGKNGLNTYNKDAIDAAGLLEQGIVNVFFDTNKDTPNAASANNLYFIINYLKNNPEASVRVKGYADVTGNAKLNEDLAKRRATNVTNFITNSGVNASQIEILGQGVDNKMDQNSKTGLQLARRVSFELVKK